MSSQVIRMESRRRFVARCGTESMKKCFLPWLTSAIYLDAPPRRPGPAPESRAKGNYATVIMAAVMFADGTNSERAPACADTRNMCIHDKYI